MTASVVLNPHRRGAILAVHAGPIAQLQPWPALPDGTMMATDITISSTTPSTADSAPCWECSRPAAMSRLSALRPPGKP